MDPTLRDSYSACRDLARRAGNFYYAFLTLPTDQFWAMCALYGFTRLVDDAGDDTSVTPDDRTRALQKWRCDLTSAIDGDTAGSLVLPALMDTVRKYQIPAEYLYALIQGVEMDLHPVRYQSYSELADYSYHVAGVVGLCCIHVWGFSDPRAKSLAVTLGEAFQLTNILRDLKEDILLDSGQNASTTGNVVSDYAAPINNESRGLGRCYLPQDEMARFGYTEIDLRAGTRNEKFHSLMEFEVQRARELYASADELKRYLNPVGISVLHTMVQLYRGILDEIERRDYDVFTRRIRLSTWKKIYFAISGILCRFYLGRFWMGSSFSSQTGQGRNRTGTGHVA